MFPQMADSFSPITGLIKTFQHPSLEKTTTFFRIHGTFPRENPLFGRWAIPAYFLCLRLIWFFTPRIAPLPQRHFSPFLGFFVRFYESRQPQDRQALGRTVLCVTNNCKSCPSFKKVSWHVKPFFFHGVTPGHKTVYKKELFLPQYFVIFKPR